jgi:hypothetical protein
VYVFLCKEKFKIIHLETNIDKMMKILKGVFILQQRRPKNTSQTPAAAV